MTRRRARPSRGALSGRQGSVLSERLALGGFSTYAEYLRSPHWRAFSASVRKRSCERAGCGARTKLEVHHVTYVRLGAELPTDVRTLCKRCHTLIHKTRGSLDPARLPPAKGPSDAPGRRPSPPSKIKRKIKSARFMAANALSVACPECRARRGSSCFSPDGTRRSTHKSRKALAMSIADPITKTAAQRLKSKVDERR